MCPRFSSAIPIREANYFIRPNYRMNEDNEAKYTIKYETRACERLNIVYISSFPIPWKCSRTLAFPSKYSISQEPSHSPYSPSAFPVRERNSSSIGARVLRNFVFIQHDERIVKVKERKREGWRRMK